MNSLTGRRLSLREFAAEDALALFEAVEASRAMLRRRLRWVSSVASPEDCRIFIRGSLAEGEKGGRLVCGVFEPGGRLAGIAALQGMLERPGLAEISGWVRADRRERGYALEAGRLLVGHAFRKEGLERLYARIDPANRAARKVVKRLGFSYEGCLRRDKRLNGRWIDQECWGLLKPEWKK